MERFKKIFALLLIQVFILGMVHICMAKVMHEKKAIVIACFGTTYPETLKDILLIKKSVESAFPTAKVRLAFTSNIIRGIWHKRQNNPHYKHIPHEILYVKGVLATIADLQDEGYKTIIVQPTHIYAGEEFSDLTSYVKALSSIETIKPKYRPFHKIALGRPILGMPGPQHDYHEDLKIAAEALRDDVELAKKENAALVYMGHGNEFYSTGAYIEFQQTMRKMYPDAKIFVGTVEGFPSFEDVMNGLLHVKIKKVVLKPFMIVAGDHARNDMAGKQKDSWKSMLEARGIKVIPVLKGLGENKKIRQIIIQHIKDAAKDNGIEL